MHYFYYRSLVESQEKLTDEEIIKKIHNESFSAIVHTIAYHCGHCGSGGPRLGVLVLNF